ncbi:hypothetical protein ACFLX9_03100 [Chloroflexota bacterium]
MNDSDQGPSLCPTDRCALVLEPTGTYLEWARRCPEGDADLSLEELRAEGTVYLIPEIEGWPETWLRHNYSALFEHELAAWCMDDSLRPLNRSFGSFKKFFEIRFCSVVLDMVRRAIRKEKTGE